MSTALRGAGAERLLCKGYLYGPNTSTASTVLNPHSTLLCAAKRSASGECQELQSFFGASDGAGSYFDFGAPSCNTVSHIRRPASAVASGLVLSTL